MNLEKEKADLAERKAALEHKERTLALLAVQLQEKETKLALRELILSCRKSIPTNCLDVERGANQTETDQAGTAQSANQSVVPELKP